jgi:uncharacterized protein (TIGR02996 family)
VTEPREATFLAALAADPGDDATRLVYSDWLEQEGDAERAELLRLQVRVGRPVEASLAADLRRLCELRTRVDATWQELVDGIAVRRDPRWLCASLGGETERTALGSAAPPPLAELWSAAYAKVLEEGGDEPRREELLWGWPQVVLVKLAVTAARMSLGTALGADAMTKAGPRRAWGFETNDLERIVSLLNGVDAWLEARLDGREGAVDPMNYEQGGISSFAEGGAPELACMNILMAAADNAALATQDYPLWTPGLFSAPDHACCALGCAINLLEVAERVCASSSSLHAAPAAEPALSYDARARGLLDAVSTEALAWLRSQRSLPLDRMETNCVRERRNSHGPVDLARYDYAGRLVVFGPRPG